MKLGVLNQNYQRLVEQKKWQEAYNICSKVRNLYPNQDFGFINGGICLKEQGYFLDAALMWSLKPCKRSYKLLSDILGRNELSEFQFEFIMYKLLEEKFSFEESTSLIDKLWHEKGINSNLYIKMHSFLVNNTQKANNFTLLSIGILDKNEDLLKEIYESGKIDLIRKVLTTQDIHTENLSYIKENFKNLKHNNKLLKNNLISFFENEKPIKITKNKKKLKIAVCISGQARGYQEAFKTWDIFKFSEHDFDFYCSFWDDLGRKPITKPHLYRHFNNEFSQLFLKDTESLSPEKIKARYNELYNLIDEKNQIDVENVLKTYKPKDIEIIKSQDFKGHTGMYCMHYMIQRAFNLIKDPGEYDLIVRIRADKEIAKSNICWNSLFEESKNRTLFCNGGSSLTPNVGIVMGDQFSVSTPEIMRIYSNTFDDVIKKRPPFDVYLGFKPHMTLAISTLNNDIKIKKIPSEMVKWGRLLDAKKHSNLSIYDAIRKCNIDKKLIEEYKNILL